MINKAANSVINFVSDLIEFLFFAIFVKDSFHLLNGSSVLRLEDLFSSLCDFLLKHEFIFSKQEFQPRSLSFVLDLNSHILVNSLILVLNEGNEVLGLMVELIFPS